MSRIFWDTNLFVYLIEDRGARGEQVSALRRRMIERGDELLTSALTLGEVLVKPVEAGDEDLQRRYEHAITTGATVVPFDAQAAPPSRTFAGIGRFARLTPSSSPARRRPERICSSRTTID